MDYSSLSFGQYFYVPVGAILVFFGVLAAAWILIRTVRDEKLPLKFLSDHLLYFVFIPLLLSRIGRYVYYFPLSESQVENMTTWQVIWETVFSFFIRLDTGFDSGWGLMGFFLTFFLIAMWKKQRHFAWMDAFLLPGIVLWFFISVGGYFSVWGHGSPAPDWLPFPLTVTYDMQRFQFFYESFDFRNAEPTYAVQLYMSVFLLFAFWVGWHFWQHKIWKKWPTGKFSTVMILILSVGNIFMESFRGDATVLIFGFRLGQVVSFFVAIVALVVLGMFFQKKDSLLEKLHLGNRN